MDIHETLNLTCSVAKDNIAAIISKAVSAAELDSLNKWLCVIEKVKQLQGGNDDNGNGYSGRYYGGEHMAHHYSGHSRQDRVLWHIEELMEAVPTDRERRFLGELYKMFSKR